MTGSPRKHWEFIRRYMEIGPAEVLPYIDPVLDVEIGQPGKRESFAHGYKIYSTSISELMFYLFFPLAFSDVIGRWIAMRTCRQPAWPAEIKAECAIEPNDPYRVDAQHLPEKVLQAQGLEQDESDETENLPKEAEYQPDKKTNKQVYVAILFSVVVATIYTIAALFVQSPESYVHELKGRVEIARQKGLLGETSILLTEIIKIKPSAESYYNRGKYFDQHIREDGLLKDEELLRLYIIDILKDYASATEYDPDYIDVYRSRGLFYYEIQKDYPKAIEDFKKWIELDPEGPRKICESNDCEVLKFLRENNLWHGESTQRQ
jgi:tetratricopeptide (TPR) repeat protein